MELGSTFPIPTVLPLGLAVKKSPLALSLWNYKRSESTVERVAASADLGAFIDDRLTHVLSHVDAIDTVTFVPSRKSSTNPVETLLESTKWGSATWIEDALEVLDVDLDTHISDAGRFVAHGVAGDHVLLIDDTFTRGATALSAARALYDDGASQVTIVVLGRHTDLDWVTSEYIDEARQRAARDEFCPECSTPRGSGHSTDRSPGPRDGAEPWEPLKDGQEPPNDDWEPEDEEDWETDEPAEVDLWLGSEPKAIVYADDPWSTSTSVSEPSQPQTAVTLLEGDNSAHMSESVALTMTVILAAPFAIVFILPIFLANFGISLGLDRFGGLWGPAGLNGYVTFMVFALTAGGVNWLLKSIPKAAAIAVFVAALVGVGSLFFAPRDGATGDSADSSESSPSTAPELHDIANQVARERGVDPVDLGEVKNAIDSVCPAVADGLTLSQARSELEYYSNEEGIPDDVAGQILLMTELVIEYSDSIC